MNRLLAVVMAGGRSERMRASNGATHKALVEVAGVSLLERTIRRLLKRGIGDIVVVSSRNDPRIAEVVRNDFGKLARRHRASLRSFIEAEPLGTVGAVALLAQEHTDMLVTYVDNVTSLDETALLEKHRESRAVMTIATHVWLLANPFGELKIANGFLRAYDEKPTREVRICSGSFVVSPAAAAAVPRNRACGTNELCELFLKRGLPIAVYCHDEPWVDVNDALGVREAERLVARHSERFS
ncbi:MAG: sugar phosphate nucleotidyltransferase [Candidatus Cybelea sp.]